MFIEARYLKPHLGTFIKYLIFGVILSTIFGLLAYLYTTANPLSFTVPRWWPALLLIPVIIAILLTARAKQALLMITDAEDLDTINLWVQEYFILKKHMINSMGIRETMLRSKNPYNRWFGDWFGSELITMQQEDTRIIIRGPYRMVNIIDEELRFESLQFDEA